LHGKAFESAQVLDVWSTFSLVNNHRFTYIMSSQLANTFTVPMVELTGGLPTTGDAAQAHTADDGIPSFVAFDFWEAQLRGNISLVPVCSSSPLVLPTSHSSGDVIAFHYHVVAPVIGRFVLLGEVDKMVTGCHRRLSQLEATADELQAVVLAAPGEDVHLEVVLPAQLSAMASHKTVANTSVSTRVTCASKQCGSDECASSLVCSATACVCN